MVGPNHECPPLCLSCLEPVTTDVTCDQCRYPVCDQVCADNHQLTNECAALSRGQAPVFQDPEAKSEVYKVDGLINEP